MTAISAYLPDDYQAAQMIEAAGRMGSIGARLAQLYIERAYHMVSAEHEAVAAIDDEIASVHREARGQ
jgi:hypothetical protein